MQNTNIVTMYLTTFENILKIFFRRTKNHFKQKQKYLHVPEDTVLTYCSKGSALGANRILLLN